MTFIMTLFGILTGFFFFGVMGENDAERRKDITLIFCTLLVMDVVLAIACQFI